MIEVRTHAGFGTTSSARLDALHHFSFAGYLHPERDGFGHLRVLNHAVLAPRAEIRPQPIDGVDIVTFVRRGALEHMGSFTDGCRTIAGEVQLISTSGGIEHGLYNPGNRPAEYVEIRVRAASTGDRPARHVAPFPTRDQKSRLIVLASAFAQDRGAMPARADARIWAARIRTGDALSRKLACGRRAYALCLSGRLEVNGAALGARDAAAIAGEPLIHLRAVSGCELLLIETA